MKYKALIFILSLFLGWSAGLLWEKWGNDRESSYYKSDRNGLVADSYFGKGFGVMGTYNVVLRKFRHDETGEDYYRIYKDEEEAGEGIEVVSHVPFYGLMYTKNDKKYDHWFALNEKDKTSWEMTGYEIMDASGNPFFNKDSFQPGTGALKPWEIRRVFVVERKKNNGEYVEMILQQFFGIPQ